MTQKMTKMYNRQTSNLSSVTYQQIIKAVLSTKKWLQQLQKTIEQKQNKAKCSESDLHWYVTVLAGAGHWPNMIQTPKDEPACIS